MRPPGPERPAALGLLLAAMLLGGCTQWRYELGQPLSPETIGRSGQLTTLATVLAGIVGVMIVLIVASAIAYTQRAQQSSKSRPE